MLSQLRHLSFEINDLCNLEKQHPQCPRNADRFANSESDESITVEDIVAFYRYAADQCGFNGLVNVHYYNEPLLTKDRLLEIVDRLPDARFSLWTNGLLLEKDWRKSKFLNLFEDVMITIYPYANLETMGNIRLHYPHVRFQMGNLDNRIAEQVPVGFNPRITSCNRPNWELIVDYYGNGHICCGDFRGDIRIGNIKKLDYADFLTTWDFHRRWLSKPWDEAGYEKLPVVCKLCLSRTPIMGQVSDRDLAVNKR